jgi:hypothetical protein
LENEDRPTGEVESVSETILTTTPSEVAKTIDNSGPTVRFESAVDEPTEYESFTKVEAKRSQPPPDDAGVTLVNELKLLVTSHPLLSSVNMLHTWVLQGTAADVLPIVEAANCVVLLLQRLLLETHQQLEATPVVAQLLSTLYTILIAPDALMKVLNAFQRVASHGSLRKDQQAALLAERLALIFRAGPSEPQQQAYCDLPTLRQEHALWRQGGVVSNQELFHFREVMSDRLDLQLKVVLLLLSLLLFCSSNIIEGNLSFSWEGCGKS